MINRMFQVYLPEAYVTSDKNHLQITIALIFRKTDNAGVVNSNVGFKFVEKNRTNINTRSYNNQAYPVPRAHCTMYVHFNNFY